MSTPPIGIEAVAGRSPLVRTALEMAREAHAGQIRNASGGRPYIDHPVAVAEKLAEHISADEVLAAALLHDVVEDSELEVEDVRSRCGDRVAEIVDALTDDATVEPYDKRKQEHRDRVEAAGQDALAIYAADKLTNVEMLRTAHRKEGETVERELKVPLDEKVEIWEQDLEMLRENAAESPAIRALASNLGEQLKALAADRTSAAQTPSS
jgi:GTP diphosphokinase / guanosine-3',5'-bis(diphosphate) 3'-diphosphatase